MLLEKAQATCQQLLKANRAQLDALAQRLLEREVISGDELKGLLGPRVLGTGSPAYRRNVSHHAPMGIDSTLLL